MDFRNIQNISPEGLKHIWWTMTLLDVKQNPLMFRWESATLSKKLHITTPVSPVPSFGDVLHYNISYGNGWEIRVIIMIFWLSAWKIIQIYS